MSSNLTKAAYEALVAEDLDWLSKQPRTLERDHIEACVRASVDHCYPSEQPAKPSPAWVWKTLSDEFVTGTLDVESVTAHATVLRSRVHVTIRAVAGNIVEMHTTLPAWSLAQCKRWVEQWVASQADAAVAAFEAAEEGR